VKERTLQDVKVGDLVASMGTSGPGSPKWTGALHQVERVASKRFRVLGRWRDKSTGREPGHSHGYYVMATPEMIARHRAAQTAAKEAEDTLKAFHARPDYRDASAIHFLLDQMSPGEHPLDKLTPAEWAALIDAALAKASKP
jgi:hypothetical protein